MAKRGRKSRPDGLTLNVLAPISDQIRALIFETERRYGISMGRMAVIAGVAKSELSRFVCGECDLPLEVLDKLTNALRLRIHADTDGTDREYLSEENLRHLAVKVFKARTGRAVRSVVAVFDWWLCRNARWKRHQAASATFDRLEASSEQRRKWDQEQQALDVEFCREWRQNNLLSTGNPRNS